MSVLSRDLIVITLPKGSSGLGRYIADGFMRAGCQSRLLDPLASKLHKVWPVIRSFSLNRERMWKRRWENELFSSWAWDRNSRHIGRRLDRMMNPGTRVLIVGKDYFPHPDYQRRDYFIFIHSNMRLSLADGVTPWLPPRDDIPAFLERETALFRHARHIFVGAQYVVESLTRDYGVDPARVSIAGGGVNEYFEDNLLDQAPADIKDTLIFVGWDFGMKGGPDLLQAFALARAVRPQLKLLVVGPDAKSLPAMAGVHYVGPVRERAQLLAWFRKADMFVMPSLRDSFGFVFLEAMSQGLPCIGSRLHAMPEIIADGVCGWVVPPRQPEALASALLKFYADPTYRKTMGDQALKRVRENYTWKVTIDRMQKVMWPANPSP